MSRGVRTAVGGHARLDVGRCLLLCCHFAPQLGLPRRTVSEGPGSGPPGLRVPPVVGVAVALSPALLQSSRPGGWPFPSPSARGAGQRGTGRRASCDPVSEATPVVCPALPAGSKSRSLARPPAGVRLHLGPSCVAWKTLCRLAPGPAWGGAAGPHCGGAGAEQSAWLRAPVGLGEGTVDGWPLSGPSRLSADPPTPRG